MTVYEATEDNPKRGVPRAGAASRRAVSFARRTACVDEAFNEFAISYCLRQDSIPAIGRPLAPARELVACFVHYGWRSIFLRFFLVLDCWTSATELKRMQLFFKGCGFFNGCTVFYLCRDSPISGFF